MQVISLKLGICWVFLNCAVFWQNFTLQLVETFCGLLWLCDYVRLFMGRAESRSSFCWRCLWPLPPGTRSPWVSQSQWFEALACRSRRCPSSKALSGGGSDGSRKSGRWPAASGTPNAWPKRRCFPVHITYTHHQTFPASKHFLQDVRNWKNIFSDPPFWQ